MPSGPLRRARLLSAEESPGAQGWCGSEGDHGHGFGLHEPGVRLGRDWPVNSPKRSLTLSWLRFEDRLQIDGFLPSSPRCSRRLGELGQKPTLSAVDEMAISRRGSPSRPYLFKGSQDSLRQRGEIAFVPGSQSLIVGRAIFNEFSADALVQKFSRCLIGYPAPQVRIRDYKSKWIDFRLPWIETSASATNLPEL
jgi:hypothetical protein